MSVLALGLAALFCVVRAIADLAARRYLWGSFGMAAGLALLVVPVRTHAVKIDLPMAGPSR